MKPEDISRLNKKINSIVKPIEVYPYISGKDLISKISNINIIPVNSDFTKLTKIAEEFKNKLYSQAFVDIEKLTDYSSKGYDLAKFQNEILKKYNFYDYDFSDIIEDYQSPEEDKNEDIPNVRNVILDETEKLKGIIFDIYLNNQNLYKISPRDFEKMIAELLFEKGFEVELTKQTRDNGYDILALKYVDDFSPIKYLVECKKYSPERKVGVEIIRSFKEVLLTEQANKGIIVTTSYFSKDAIVKRDETPLLLDYKNKDELMEWVKAYYLKNVR